MHTVKLCGTQTSWVVDAHVEQYAHKTGKLSMIQQARSRAPAQAAC